MNLNWFRLEIQESISLNGWKCSSEPNDFCMIRFKNYKSYSETIQKETKRRSNKLNARRSIENKEMKKIEGEKWMEKEWGRTCSMSGHLQSTHHRISFNFTNSRTLEQRFRTFQSINTTAICHHCQTQTCTVCRSVRVIDLADTVDCVKIIESIVPNEGTKRDDTNDIQSTTGMVWRSQKCPLRTVRKSVWIHTECTLNRHGFDRQ